jgi:hypothetical protein
VRSKTRPPRLSGMEKAAGILSLAAGGIHGGVSPQHFEEWWGYGLFFIFAAAAQSLFGLAILTRAINLEDTGPQWRRWRWWMYVLGISGNVAIFILYIVTRTVGIPLLGPEAGEVEPVAPVDILSKLTEAALMAVLWVMVRREGEAMRMQAGPKAEAEAA